MPPLQFGLVSPAPLADPMAMAAYARRPLLLVPADPVDVLAAVLVDALAADPVDALVADPVDALVADPVDALVVVLPAVGQAGAITAVTTGAVTAAVTAAAHLASRSDRALRQPSPPLPAPSLSRRRWS
jgi:hypothetical protein